MKNDKIKQKSKPILKEIAFFEVFLVKLTDFEWNWTFLEKFLDIGQFFRNRSVGAAKRRQAPAPERSGTTKNSHDF